MTTRTPHRRRRLSAVVATLVSALALSSCSVYDIPLPGGPDVGSNPMTVHIMFRDVLDLVPQSTVKVDDVTVGKVTSIKLKGYTADVTVKLPKSVDLPDNPRAEIRQTSLLGEKFVSLSKPDDPTGKLGNGDVIGLENTGRNPEIEEVFSALALLLNGGGVGQLGTITQELNNMMDGRTQRLRHLLGSLSSVIGTIDDQKQDIISAMQSMNGLAATLNHEKGTIAGALNVMGPAVKVLDAQHDELVQMLGKLDKLGRVGTHVIGQSKDDILKSLDHLQPVLQRLYEAGDQLAPGLNLLVSFPFPKEASEIVKGDYANTSIRADISLENIIPSGQEGGGIPPVVPDPGQTLDAVTKCLRSGDLQSKPCQKVLASVDLVKKLKKQCQKKRYDGNPVCTIVEALPGDGGGPLGGLLGGLTGGVLGRALTDGTPSPAPSPESLYGGA